MKKSVLLALLLPVFAVGAAEWNHSKSGYNPTGQVNIKLQNGAVLALSSAGQSGLQSSSSPAILNVSAGASYNFDVGFQLQSGEYYVRETSLKNWVKFSKTDFESQFTVQASGPLKQLTYDNYTYTTQPISASGSGVAEVWNNGNSTNVSLNCTIQGNSQSASAAATTSINLVAYAGSDYGQLSCIGFATSVGSSWVRGTLYTYASINAGIYENYRTCTHQFFYDSYPGWCGAACKAQASGSVVGSCQASDEGYVLWDSGVLYGFSKARHYLKAGGVSNNAATLSLSGITKAFVDTASNIFYIQRNTSLMQFNPTQGAESFITNINGSDVPSRVVSGLQFTPKSSTPP